MTTTLDIEGARATLYAAHVQLYPEAYPPAVQIAHEVIREGEEPYTSEHPREWDSAAEFLEWLADDVSTALDKLGGPPA